MSLSIKMNQYGYFWKEDIKKSFMKIYNITKQGCAMSYLPKLRMSINGKNINIKPSIDKQCRWRYVERGIPHTVGGYLN